MKKTTLALVALSALAFSGCSSNDAVTFRSPLVFERTPSSKAPTAAEAATPEPRFGTVVGITDEGELRVELDGSRTEIRDGRTVSGKETIQFPNPRRIPLGFRVEVREVKGNYVATPATSKPPKKG